MAWLLAGSFLLFAVLGKADPAARGDLPRIVALLLLAAAFAWSFRVYAPWAPVAAFAAGAGAAFLVLRLAPAQPGTALRAAALGVGAACTAFALFGPAEGLF